ncbi:protein H2A.6-like [Aegilops tauschii subsp. strangulata]|uniref:protein H2A.6-like n=1 Tax=Aegilops tauschii subsp. strangulata TaxID=200361 RepID=UPI003CC8D8AE
MVVRKSSERKKAVTRSIKAGLHFPMLYLAGNAPKDNKKTNIMPCHLQLATCNDEELSKLLDGITIAHNGMLPNIHSVLFYKRANMH